MKKRILINLLLAFALEPTIQLTRDYVKMEILDDHSSFSGSRTEYIGLQPIMTFLISPFIFLIGVLFPYNVLLLHFNKGISNYVTKAGLFLLVLTSLLCIAGTVMNVWLFPIWKNAYYLCYFIPYSFLFAGLIHWLVDKKDRGNHADR